MSNDDANVPGPANPTHDRDPAEVGFTCLHCGRTSYNPNDREHRYCGWCRHFCDNVSGR